MPKIKQSLALLTDLTSGPGGIPFGLGPGGKGPAGDVLGALAAMIEEAGIDPDDLLGPDGDFDDDFDDDDDFAPAPPPRPKRKKR